LELYDVMRTTFAARDFTDEPVPDSVLRRILENARFAPSGGNRQGWRVVVAREAATRERLASLIAPTHQRYFAQMQAGEAPFNTVIPSKVSEQQVAATKAPFGFVNSMVNAPVLLLVFVDLSVVASFDSNMERVGVVSGASIYPFVWNILLAARNEGYGGTITTLAVAQEAKVKDLLNIPPHVAVSAVIPLGEPVKRLTRLRRKPVPDFARHASGDGEPLSAGT